MNRIVKMVIGAALVAYGVYSGNQWFYFGFIPFMMGLCDKCPLGGCEDGACDVNSSCCNSEEEIKNDTSNCCTSKHNEETACCSQKKPKTMTFSSVAPIEKKDLCCSNNNVTVIKILGTGCSNCVTLYNTVNEAIKQLDRKFEVIKIEDIEEIMKYSVISTPGLVINEVVKSTGKVLNIQEVIELINGSTEELGNEIKTKCCGGN